MWNCLMYISKSKGPRTDPCGSPYDVIVSLEGVLFIEVCCLLKFIVY